MEIRQPINNRINMITLANARLMRAEHVLLENADLTVNKSQKIGVIGRNGSGKSSLFACLTGRLALDAGELHIPDGLRCAWMKQETAGSATSAIDHVIDGDAYYRDIEAQLLAAEAAQDGHAIARLHAELDKIDGYSIRVRAEQMLAGLGFAPDSFEHPVASFSGGWRIRLNLAAALMAPSDLLLLDEPTNHLDLEATLWLEEWLTRYPGTLLLISHDRGFLDKVIDHVVSFENQRLYLYRGNYSAYERQRAERMAQQQAAFEKQKRRQAEIEDFVKRFRAKASKARQAQSRLKELDRMQEIAPAHIDSPFRFQFLSPEKSSDDLLGLKKVSIGFDQPLVSNISLKLHRHSRIGLLGFNGMGKSTLLKSLAGQLPWQSSQPSGKPDGEIIASKHLRIGYFAQHQVDVMDMEASPLLLIQRLNSQAREQEIRNFLGGFDFRNDRINETIGNFSGGEKARLALALIVWQRPNLLLLDEPTNHLDLEMRHALTVALQGFDGAVVLVSHDRHLMANTVDEFYMVHRGRFSEFDGDLEDYTRHLQSQDQHAQASGPVSESSDSSAPDRKELRRQAAAQREQLAPLRSELKSLEKKMAKISAELTRLEAQLADNALYEEAQRDQLTELLRKQGQSKSELEQVEERWLEVSTELEG